MLFSVCSKTCFIDKTFTFSLEPAVLSHLHPHQTFSLYSQWWCQGAKVPMLLMLQYQTLGIWILRQTTKNTLLPMCCLKRKSKKTSRTSSIVLLFLAQQNSLSMSWLLQRKQGVILQEIPFPCSNSCSHVLDMSTFCDKFCWRYNT